MVNASEIIVFINPNSSYGNGFARFRSIEGLLRKKLGKFGVETLISPETVHAQVENAIRSGKRVLIGAGGDGTVNLLANAVISACADLKIDCSPVTIGAIGLGSSNDFHKPMSDDKMICGIPVLVDFENACLCDAIRVDYEDDRAQSRVRYCFINASAGVTANANALFNSRGALIRAARKISLDAAILTAALLSISGHRNIACSLSIDGGRPEAVMLTNIGIIKNPNFSGSLSYDTPILMDDGRIGINLCDGMSLAEMLSALYRLYNKRFAGRAKTRAWLAEKAELAAASPFALEIDGEIVMTKSARLEVFKKGVLCCK